MPQVINIDQTERCLISPPTTAEMKLNHTNRALVDIPTMLARPPVPCYLLKTHKSTYVP